MASEERIIPLNLEDEMKSAYIDYSMSVIVSRALPDARDGMKPVHRRVLYGMYDLGVTHNRPYKKSARIVGEVLGKYHPHGDSSVYDTMVRMAQPWSMRYPLVDGQGNFGSIDGDSPAAMRYTEARLTRIAEEMLTDIQKNTVDFQPNFDESLQEPLVLPGKVPNLLINGIAGIAVGMATNMPPHNLSEVVDGIIAYIDNPEVSIEELMQYIKAPDFPTGGVIYGFDGVKDAFEKGKGKVTLRAKADIETSSSGKEQIIVTEVPYLVNKANMILKTANLVEEKQLEGISDIRDESDRNGFRVVYDLKKDAVPNVVLNKLFKYTQLQSTFSVNNIALVKGRPEPLDLKDLIKSYVDHRHDVVIRRAKYELEEAEKRAHVLEGLIIAIDNLDEVIELIRGSESPDKAKEGLMEKFELSDVQARAILDMRLQKLTGLERDNLKKEYNDLLEEIRELKELLNNEDKRMEMIKDELRQVKKDFGDERRSEIQHAAEDMSIEDMIPKEDVVVTMSHNGYIKRTPLTTYRTQNRGGKGSRAAASKEDDFVEKLFVASTHDYMLFFTEQGKCYWLKVYEIPEGGKNTRGRAIQNLLEIDPEDRILTYITLEDLTKEENIKGKNLVFCTRQGVIKKTPVEAYSRPRSKGINAIKIQEGDELVNVVETDGNQDIILATKEGQAIRFPENKVRQMGRVSTGVRGIRMKNQNDEVVGMIGVDQETHDSIMVLSEKGHGKRTKLDEYRITNRGGKGIRTFNITEKTGKLIGMTAVNDENDLMIINRSGIMIRIGTENIPLLGRSTQGVRLIRLTDKDRIAAMAKVEKMEEEDQEEAQSSEAEEEGGEEEEME